MASTFFGLNIGYTGLVSAQASLNTTGNNIANVETEGYSRQKAVQQAANAIRTNTSYGMAGAGVDTISIDQIRNQYYDYKYWNNNSDLGIYSIKKQYAAEIEAYFTDTDSVQGFNVLFSNMFDSLDEVRKSSGDDTVKTQFISDCQTLTEYFNAMYTNMQRLQADANDEIQNKINQINSLASDIATLNKQINNIEITGPRANELRDKRALLVDELSKVIDVEVAEIPIYQTEGKQADGSDPLESGIFRYEVRVAGGQELVKGYEFSTLECVARDYKVNQSDADGLYDIRWSSGVDFYLYGGNLGGELKGLIDVRDGNNDEYFHGNVTDISKDDTTGVQTVSIEVDESLDYLTDLNKLTLNGTGIIALGNKEFSYTEWEVDVDADGKHTYKFALSDDSSDASEYKGRKAEIGTTVDYQGIPYYMSQLNEWCRVFAQAMNKIELTAQDTYGNPAEVLFKATNNSDNDNNYDFDKYDYEKTSKTQGAKSSEDNYQKLTAETFTINKNMKNDVNLFGTSKDVVQGQDAQDITVELLSVKADKDKASFRGTTAGEFLQCITTDTALNASSANSFYANYDKISSSIVNQRLSEMSVDNDEEALNLVKFQEAFNLASKMIQVMTEIYDRLILSTGV